MKKILPALLAFALLLFPGCSSPDALRLDLSQGYSEQMKLLHLNASTKERRERIEGFAAILQEAQPLEKDFSLFAYYPDYLIEVTRDGEKTSALVDINGEFVDFCYPEEQVIYRSAYSANDLKKLIFQYS